MKKEEIKPFLWGAVVGAIVLPSALFWADFIVTTGTAHATATEMTQTAVVDRLTPICVAQFPQDETRVQRLAELKALDIWKRRDFVEMHGWATMPGSESPDSKVAVQCAQRLAQLEI